MRLWVYGLGTESSDINGEVQATGNDVNTTEVLETQERVVLEESALVLRRVVENLHKRINGYWGQGTLSWRPPPHTSP